MLASPMISDLNLDKFIWYSGSYILSHSAILPLAWKVLFSTG